MTTPAIEGGFTAVVTTVSIGPGGGTIGPVAVSGGDVTVTVPPGAFPATVTVTITAPDLATIPPQPGRAVVEGAGITVGSGGAPYPGTFLKPLSATFTSSGITPASDVALWNGSAFVTDPASTDTTGDASASFDSDPDFAIETPVITPPTPVPSATVPVTGVPVLGEGLLAGVLVLGGAGAIAASRRRRARASARKLAAAPPRGVPPRTPRGARDHGRPPAALRRPRGQSAGVTN